MSPKDGRTKFDFFPAPPLFEGAGDPPRVEGLDEDGGELLLVTFFLIESELVKGGAGVLSLSFEEGSPVLPRSAEVVLDRGAFVEELDEATPDVLSVGVTFELSNSSGISITSIPLES